MSNALAISGVTAVLQSMLQSVYNDPSTSLGSVKVSAVAPDIVQNALGKGSDSASQVNLFLHQVTPNPGWRNVGLPSLDTNGSTRLKNPPLALDLHYLLTVYAGGDGEAEALLGYAVQLLFEYPVLSRNQIRSTLSGLPPTHPLRTLLPTSGLADQIEMIKITPDALGREEMAWIWTALKADYRLTYPFQVSVVLIQPQSPGVSALPVLARTVSAQANLLSGFPTLTEIAPPQSQPAACLGDTVTVTGNGLTGATAVVLTNARLGIQQTLTALLNAADSSFQFQVPNPALPPPQPNPTDLPAGVYLLSAQVPGATDILTTNSLPLAIAPKITSYPVGPLSSGSVTLSISCTPYLRTSQQVSLLIGGQEAIATPFKTPTNSPSFAFANLQKSGGHAVPIRLRVDGIDSPIIDMTKTIPVFSGPTVTVN
jgi:hypothetical protein